MFAILKGIYTNLRSMAMVFSHATRKRDTILYPEVMPYLPPRYRGRIVLTRDPDGEERCVACNLCAVAVPFLVSPCRKENGRTAAGIRNSSASISRAAFFCGLCEEACPTSAIQLTPDFEMAEYDRQNLVYEKEHLLISGTGKVPEYNFYRVAGLAIAGKPKGAAAHEAPPVDVKGLLP